MSTGATEFPEKTASGIPGKQREIRERPQFLTRITEKIKTGYGNLYVTVNTMDGKPFEVFAQIGKSGYSTMADTEAICRLISLSLRSGNVALVKVNGFYGYVDRKGGLAIRPKYVRAASFSEGLAVTGIER